MAKTTAPTITRDTAITERSRRAPALGLIALAVAAALFGLTRTWGEPFAQGWLGHNGARYDTNPRLQSSCGKARKKRTKRGAGR